MLGIDEPRVAILAAVETVNPDMQATVDAAMLCKMADRGQITGAILDGPLAFDNAVSEKAARTKKIVSAVAGKADILLAPDLEAGNMLAKQLQYFAGADSAGVVLGARVVDRLGKGIRTAPRDALVAEYDVEPERCARDLSALLGALILRVLTQQGILGAGFGTVLGFAYAAHLIVLSLIPGRFGGFARESAGDALGGLFGQIEDDAAFHVAVQPDRVHEDERPARCLEPGAVPARRLVLAVLQIQ